MRFDQFFHVFRYGQLLFVSAAFVGGYQIARGQLVAQVAHQTRRRVVHGDERGLAHGPRHPVLLDGVLEMLRGLDHAFRAVFHLFVNRQHGEQIDELLHPLQRRQVRLEAGPEPVVEPRQTFVTATIVRGHRSRFALEVVRIVDRVVFAGRLVVHRSRGRIFSDRIHGARTPRDERAGEIVGRDVDEERLNESLRRTRRDDGRTLRPVRSDSKRSRDSVLTCRQERSMTTTTTRKRRDRGLPRSTKKSK